MYIQINVSPSVQHVIDHYSLHDLMIMETINNVLNYTKMLENFDFNYISFLLEYIKSDIEVRLDSYFFNHAKTRGFSLTADMKFSQEAGVLDLYFDFVDSKNLVLPKSNNVNSIKMN